MKITVCVKQVPNTGTDRELRRDDSTVATEAADAVINELDEFAIEEGLRLADCGVVGDLFDVVPRLTGEITRRGQEG